MQSSLFVKSLLTVLACCAVAHAQQIPKTEDNAALWYWQVFYSSQRLNENILQDAGAVLDSDGEDEQAVEAVRNHVGAHWKLLQTAASKPRCAFGVNWDEGMNAVLPHLSPMNAWAQLLHADAVGRAKVGEHAVAAERLAVMLAMADHLEDEPTLVSLLSAARAIRRAQQALEHVDVQALPARQRDDVFRALVRAENVSIERAADVFAIEGATNRRFMKRRWQGRDGRQHMNEDLDQIVFINSGESPTPGPYESLDEQYELWAALDRQIARALRDGDERRMAELGREITSGDHGWLAKIFIAPFDRVYEQITEAREHIAQMREQLEG